MNGKFKLKGITIIVKNRESIECLSKMNVLSVAHVLSGHICLY